MQQFGKLLALAFGLASFATAASAQAIELKLSHWTPPAHVNTRVFVPWADMIEKKSGGRLKITIFAGGVLGKPADHWDMAQNGVVDIAWGTHNYTAGRFPLTSAMDLPFQTNSAKGSSRALQEFYVRHLQKEHDKVKVLWLQAPAPFQLHLARKAVINVDDLAGMRIRTGGGQPAEIVKALGAVPVALAVPETYNAMDRGVVDGTILPYEASKAFKLAEVEKHVVDLRIFTTSQFTIMNLDKYKSLPDDLKTVLDEHSGVWAAEYAGAIWDQGELEGLDAMKKANVQLHKVTDAQRETWKAKAKNVEEEWIRVTEAKGLPARQALADLREFLMKYDP